MKISIKDEEIDVKFNFRAEMMYEELEGHSFQGKSNSEWLIYFFCSIICSTNDAFITFNDYITWLSENPEYFYDFVQYYTEFQKNVLEIREKQQKNKKKAAARKK